MEMSNQLPVQSNNVISFLEMSVRNQKEQANAMEVMILEMKRIENNVMAIEENIVRLAEQIKDENRLLPAEVDDLYNAVVAKSNEIAKANYSGPENEFTKYVGKIRRVIWSKLKKHCGVSKYIHIKRKDFEDALKFIQRFSLVDYI